MEIKTLKTLAILEDLAMDAFYAWMFMLAVGIARAEWLTPASDITLPTIGYGWSLLLVWMLRTGQAYLLARGAAHALKVKRGEIR